MSKIPIEYVLLGALLFSTVLGIATNIYDFWMALR